MQIVHIVTCYISELISTEEYWYSMQVERTGIGTPVLLVYSMYTIPTYSVQHIYSSNILSVQHIYRVFLLFDNALERSLLSYSE